MAPLAAIVVGLFWSTVAVFIAWGKGYSPRGIIQCVIGLLIGGVGAGWIGSYALPGWTAITSNRNTTVMACAAVLTGSLAGLFVAEWLREGRLPNNHQVLTAAFGFIFGGLGAFVILALTYDTWAEHLSKFALIPVTIATATLAGSAMSHEMPGMK